MSEEITVDIATDDFRDHVARALIAVRAADIAKEIEDDLGADDDCHGHGSERCGGCGMCLFMQATWTDYTDEGFAHWRGEADRLLANVRDAVRWQQAREATA